MRFITALSLMVLVGMSAATAKAGSIKDDPRININTAGDPPRDPTFPPPNAISSTPTDPIKIMFQVPFTIDYTYTGPTITLPPNDLWIELIGVPIGTIFTPGGNVFKGPFSFTTLLCPMCAPGTLAEAFGFTGGTLTHGETIAISQLPNIGSVPEPSTMIMFLSLGPAIGFAKRRWNARHAA